MIITQVITNSINCNRDLATTIRNSDIRDMLLVGLIGLIALSLPRRCQLYRNVRYYVSDLRSRDSTYKMS